MKINKNSCHYLNMTDMAIFKNVHRLSYVSVCLLIAKAILLLLPLTNPVPSPQLEDKKVGGNNHEQKRKQESRVWWDVEKSRRLKSRVVNEQCGNEEWESCGEQPAAFGVSEVRRLKRQLAKTQHEQVFVLYFVFTLKTYWLCFQINCNHFCVEGIAEDETDHGFERELHSARRENEDSCKSEKW